MLARLWWKEARLFWPAWALVGLAALGTQWALAWDLGADARTGLLGWVALGWSCLYACAVASAGLAGEKENRTLGFLDAHGADRRLVWWAKASFALGSTLALAALLFAAAWAGTDRWSAAGSGPALGAVGVVAVLAEVVGWGLFWSAVASNPLIAAILTVCSSAAGFATIDRGGSAGDLTARSPWRLGVAAATLALSFAVVSATRPGAARRSKGRRGEAASFDETEPTPDPAAAWRPAARALAWQTRAQAWPVFWKLAVLQLAMPVLLAVVVGEARAAIRFTVALAPAVGVIAGVSTFGAENRGRTYRVLAHHGARPGLVWAVKAGVWGGLLAALAGITMVVVSLAEPSVAYRRPAGDWGPPAGFVPLLFALTAPVGLLCGMTIRRGITAALVAAAVLMLGAVPVGSLVAGEFVPVWAFAALPVACLFVSWGWSADWLEDRPAPGRWVRLGLLLGAAAGVAFAGYVGYRVGTVPRVDDGALGPKPEARSWVEPPAPDNAAPLYGEAARALAPLPALTPDRPEGNARALDLVRRAAAKPWCRFDEWPPGLRFDPVTRTPDVGRLATLLEWSSEARRRAGDLAGAWDDILALRGLGRHLAQALPTAGFEQGLRFERQALGLAMQWAEDPEQTPERLHDALGSYLGLPPMPSAADAIAAEGGAVGRILAMPGGAVRGRYRQAYEPTSRLLNAVATAPWEVARARLAARLLYAAAAGEAAKDPYQRHPLTPTSEGWGAYVVPAETPPGGLRLVASGDDLAWVVRSTPLLRAVMGSPHLLIETADRNEVMRRALVQVLALRRWQLRHGGRLPDSLDALVLDGELSRLPVDPYSGGLFRWVVSSGQPLPRLGLSDPPPTGAVDPETVRPTYGYRLLYSIGPDRTDDQARWEQAHWSPTGDLVFPLRDKPGALPGPEPTSGGAAAGPADGMGAMMGGVPLAPLGSTGPGGHLPVTSPPTPAP